MKAFKPTAAHRSLAKMVGEWETVQRIGADPDKAVTAEGTAHGTMRYGGRFMFLEITGVGGGAPATVLVIFGYDTYKNEYQAAAVGTTGTAMYTSVGEDAVDVFDMRGEMDDELGRRPVRYLYRIVDDGKFIAEYFNTVNGKEVKVAETEFNRRR